MLRIALPVAAFSSSWPNRTRDVLGAKVITIAAAAHHNDADSTKADVLTCGDRTGRVAYNKGT